MDELRRGPEAADLAEDARHLLVELDRAVPGAVSATGECRPSLDVVDTATAVEVVVDVPGVPASALRVCIRRNTVLVVGAKVSPAAPTDARYHVAERSSGRFARAVRISGVVDASRAKAFVESGLLRIVLPRIEDRRGRLILVPVDTA
ncbi:MAG: Hsp20/alpha crystallin family protein [Acidobacteria bacterium]|jgi:HSP20 family protein|nr:Hsp20/alpha crystallin family protein [Acidobacteriota bacterium]